MVKYDIKHIMNLMRSIEPTLQTYIEFSEKVLSSDVSKDNPSPLNAAYNTLLLGISCLEAASAQAALV